MGATRNTGYLENLIQYDASDNVAIATSVNPSYKVTLGGNLLGTSATFSGIVEVGNTVGSAINSASGLGNLVVGNGGASSQGITIYTGASTYGGLNFADATTGGGAYAGYIKFDHSNNSMGFFIGNVSRLSLASTGAATFSSSVTATNVILSATGYLGFGGGTNYIEGDNANNIIRIGTNNTAKVTINGSGNVGIGTTSPQSNLHVTGTIKVATGNAQGILGLGEGAGTTVNVGIWRGAANAATTDGNYLNLGGYDGIVFATGNAAIGSQTERMRITSGGNVGIGTTSPNTKLEVYSSTAGTATIGRFGAANYGIAANKTYIQIGTQYEDGSSRIGSSNPSGNLSELFFETATATSGVFAERMRITSGGNVYIGTTSDATGAGFVANTGRVKLGDGGGFELNFNTSTYTAFQLASSEKMRITSGGNVGIGDTTVNSRLFVKSDAATNGLSVKGAGNGGTYPFRVTWTNGTEGDMLCVNDAGNVGIGTASPKLNGNNGTFTTIYNASAGAWLELATASTTDNVGGSITFNNTNIVGTDKRNAQIIGARSGANNSAYLAFITWNAGTGEERMRITSGGVVAFNGDSDVANGGIDKLSMGYRNGNYGWIQSWGGTALYLNKSGNAVYAGTQRIDNNSDARIKTNISSIENALNTVMLLSGKKFNMLDEDNILRYGFIAQEVQPYLSDFITESNRYFEKGDIRVENLLTMENSGSAWAALLVEAIKEQQAQIEELSKKIGL